MRPAQPSGDRAGFGAAAFAVLALAGCAVDAAPSPIGAFPTVPASVAATAGVASSTPAPSSPTAFALEKVDGTFPSVVSLTSTGAQLYWASEGSIWRFSPGDAGPGRVYQSSIEGAVVWDVAATDAAFVFSERLAKPAGSWRVAHVVGDAPLVEIDSGIAERGAPPTLSIDDRRIAWAGFDESSGAPRSFLRVVDRTNLHGPITTLRDVDIDDGLLWYPQLDRDTLWYSIIEPDFDGTGEGDALRIETIELTKPAVEPTPFEGVGNDFDPAVSADYVVWKSVDPGFAALTWGQLHVLDRRTNERLVIAGQANHPSIGSRFVAFEEISHQKLLLYDLATRALLEVPDPMRGVNGTLGVPAIAGHLLGYSVSAKGANTVYWTTLPD